MTISSRRCAKRIDCGPRLVDCAGKGSLAVAKATDRPKQSFSKPTARAIGLFTGVRHGARQSSTNISAHHQLSRAPMWTWQVEEMHRSVILRNTK